MSPPIIHEPAAGDLSAQEEELVDILTDFIRRLASAPPVAVQSPSKKAAKAA